MPTLSVYIGESRISTLEYVSPTNFKFGYFPFVFPKELVRGSSNMDKFLKQVLKFLEKKEVVGKNFEQIVVTNISGNIDTFGTNYYSLDESLNSIESYNWVISETFLLQNREHKVCKYPIKKDLTFDQPVMVNYLSNKFLYPSLVPSAPDTLRAEDVLTKYLARDFKLNFDASRPVLFTGGRFTYFPYYPIQTYLNALDLLHNSGIYNVKIDISNKLPTIGGLNLGVKDIASESKDSITFASEDLVSFNGENVFEEEFMTLGTVLVSPGGVECMFESGLGKAQFVQLGADELFIFPLEKSEGARVVANGKNINTLEKNIRGGKLGFVIDTRIKEGADFQTMSSMQNTEWVKVINERIEAF